MKSRLCLFLLSFCFANVTFAQSQNQLVLSEREIRTSDGRASVQLKFENTFDQSIVAIRAMVVLLDDDGKAVGNKSQWLGGMNGSGKQLNFEPEESKTFPIKIKTSAKATKASVFITRIILEDGSKPNLSRSLSKKAEEN